MITAVKVAVQARSEGFLVLHHVLGLAAARRWSVSTSYLLCIPKDILKSEIH